MPTMEWQPIETAPKDEETEIIIAGHWGGEPDAPQFVTLSRRVPGLINHWEGHSHDLVTHWMPLPEPPKGEKE